MRIDWNDDCLSSETRNYYSQEPLQGQRGHRAYGIPYSRIHSYHNLTIPVHTLVPGAKTQFQVVNTKSTTPPKVPHDVRLTQVSEEEPSREVPKVVSCVSKSTPLGSQPKRGGCNFGLEAGRVSSATPGSCCVILRFAVDCCILFFLCLGCVDCRSGRVHIIPSHPIPSQIRSDQKGVQFPWRSGNRATHIPLRLLSPPLFPLFTPCRPVHLLVSPVAPGAPGIPGH